MTNEDRKVLTAKPDAPAVPRGLDFHCETALTQARMAYGTACNEALEMQQEQLQCVIEQLEEMAAKLKAAKGNVPAIADALKRDDLYIWVGSDYGVLRCAMSGWEIWHRGEKVFTSSDESAAVTEFLRLTEEA